MYIYTYIHIYTNVCYLLSWVFFALAKISFLPGFSQKPRCEYSRLPSSLWDRSMMNFPGDFPGELRPACDACDGGKMGGKTGVLFILKNLFLLKIYI